MGDTTHVHNIRTYGDRSKRFIGLSQSTSNLKETRHVELKMSSCLIEYGMTLSDVNVLVLLFR